MAENTTAPAFQFYPKDYQTSEHVQLMTLEERGAYVDLLCACWTNGSIPSDTRKLAALVGTAPDHMEEIWPALEPCFDEAGDGRLVNPRLERERQKQEAYRKRMSKAGRKAARARWSAREKPGRKDPPPRGAREAAAPSRLQIEDPRKSKQDSTVHAPAVRSHSTREPSSSSALRSRNADEVQPGKLGGGGGAAPGSQRAAPPTEVEEEGTRPDASGPADPQLPIPGRGLSVQLEPGGAPDPVPDRVKCRRPEVARAVDEVRAGHREAIERLRAGCGSHP